MNTNVWMFKIPTFPVEWTRWNHRWVFLLCFGFIMFDGMWMWLEISLIEWLAIWLVLIIETQWFSVEVVFFSFVISTHTALYTKNWRKKNWVQSIGYVYVHLCSVLEKCKFSNEWAAWKRKFIGGLVISMRHMSHAVFACHWFEMKPIKMTSVEMNMVCENQNPFQ